MRNYIISISAVIISLFLISTVSAAESKLTKVKVRYDHKYNFSQLENNYIWTDYKGSSKSNNQGYVEKIDVWVIDAVNRSMSSMSYNLTSIDKASFGIDYQIVVQDEGASATHVKRGGSRVNPRSYTNIEGMPSIQNWREGTLLLNIVNLKTGYVI